MTVSGAPVGAVSPGPGGAVSPGPGSAVPPGGYVPAPPPGPGVQPPFAAPPTEGDRRRMWLGLGAGGLALVLCCIGGLVGIGGLMVTTVQAINEQAQKTVGSYLDALRAEEYDDAYDLLCDSVQGEESKEEFASRVASEPRVASFQLSDPEIANRIIVPARIQFADGDADTLRFVLERDNQTGTFEVCGLDE